MAKQGDDSQVVMVVVYSLSLKQHPGILNIAFVWQVIADASQLLAKSSPLLFPAIDLVPALRLFSSSLCTFLQLASTSCRGGTRGGTSRLTSQSQDPDSKVSGLEQAARGTLNLSGTMIRS